MTEIENLIRKKNKEVGSLHVTLNAGKSFTLFQYFEENHKPRRTTLFRIRDYQKIFLIYCPFVCEIIFKKR